MKMYFGSENELLAFKKYIISLLIMQAQSDNDFSIKEKKYLKYVGEQLDLTDKEVAEIRINPQEFAIRSPSDEYKRVTILYYLLFMMKADQNVSKKEEEICYKVGLILGFREEMVTNLINVMKEYLHQKMPADVMLNKIKPFLN